MAQDDERLDWREDELANLELEDELDDIHDQIDGINDRLDNFVTREQLEKVKSDLMWRFVIWTIGFVACIVAIVGVVIAALSFLSN